MDWFSWLSKTTLESSIVYEYSLAFAQNELEEEDIAFFNHEFLQSMGITIAKHRLEILKLARREKSHGSKLKHPMAKLLLILKKTKKSLTNYIATLVHGEDSSRALIVVSNKNKLKRKNKISGGAISYSSRWKRAMMMRNNSKRLVMVNNSGISNNNNNNNNQEKLMITNGDYYGDYIIDGDNDDLVVVSTPKIDSYSSPLMYDLQQNSKDDKIPDDDQLLEDDDQYWTPALEEIRWDAMFQDLKPT